MQPIWEFRLGAAVVLIISVLALLYVIRFNARDYEHYRKNPLRGWPDVSKDTFAFFRILGPSILGFVAAIALIATAHK